MRVSRQLAGRVTMAVAVAALGTASAFAEVRPREETRGERIGKSNIVRRDQAQERRGDRSANRDEGRREEPQRVVRGDRRGDGRDREVRRDQGRARVRTPAPQSQRAPVVVQEHRAPARVHVQHRPYYAHGRVSRVRPYRGGYQVWIAGTPYPFFIPTAHFHRDRFRVGLVINLGGIYNRGGYYDYYDGRHARGRVRGYVESVDYRRDAFVMRNDATGSFVTVFMRDRYRNVRPGDYVEVYGDWTRGGVFEAYEIDLLADRYRRY